MARYGRSLPIQPIVVRQLDTAGSIVNGTVTPRPFTGITIRPFAGITVRP